ncbi:AAA family ATPase [Sphingomonas sp.]|uniref:AAA family ATPase n=1 Tax=Sphingomonas sp. TaxID=28214 RepID=UPI0025F9AEC5|nr:AAA family ATPase [Sphingomonas sp.]
MTQTRQTPAAPTLIERAAQIYDFARVARPPAVTPQAPPIADEARLGLVQLPPVAPETPVTITPAQPVKAYRISRPVIPVDIDRLREAGFIIPDGPPGTLVEEFRLVKRQLILNANGGTRGKPIEHGRMILICSAQPNEGKTFCAVNLALSLASERDTEVLLVDADVAKPEVLSTLGLAGDAGLMDALADPTIDVEDLVIRTSIAKLSVLPAGKALHDDTELLASARTKVVLESLATSNPNRIVIFDSAPALAASPASVLALHVGQVLMIVRADRTTEAELKDAIALVDGCDTISLLLNAASFAGGTRSFGSYYGHDK